MAEGAIVRPYHERDGFTIYHGDCCDVLPTLEAVDHVITDPPYARHVYQRLGMPKTNAGSGTPALLGSPLRLADHHDAKTRTRNDRLGIRNHRSVSIEKLAAGAIGSIDEMLVGVAVRDWPSNSTLVARVQRYRELPPLALRPRGKRYGVITFRT